MMKVVEMMTMVLMGHDSRGDGDADGDEEDGEGEGLPQVCSEPPAQRGVSLQVRSTGTEGREQLCSALQRPGRKKGNPAFNPERSGTLLKSRQVILVPNVDLPLTVTCWTSQLLTVPLAQTPTHPEAERTNAALCLTGYREPSSWAQRRPADDSAHPRGRVTVGSSRRHVPSSWSP